jgi:cytochrome c-type biogenesis protein CcsB
VNPNAAATTAQVAAATDGLALVSNVLVYSAMAVYALAMYFFAAELAFAPRGRAARVQREHTLTGAGVATGAAAVPAPAQRTPYAETGYGERTYDATRVDTSVPLETQRARAARWRRTGGIAVALTILAFGLHLGGVVARGVATERAPWSNMYEFSVAGALMATAVFLALLARRDVRYLGLFVVGPVLLTLGLAVVVFYIEADEVVPALKSVWLVIHVAAAIVASGIFTVGASQTVLHLVQERRERVPAERRAPSFMDRFPAAAALDRAAYRMHAFAFPIWTFAVVAGAIWAEEAWGRYWGWDPKEVWAFITWVVYAAYLHARATAGWRGGRAGSIALVGYSTFLFNYIVVNIWFSGLHSYGGV